MLSVPIKLRYGTVCLKTAPEMNGKGPLCFGVVLFGRGRGKQRRIPKPKKITKRWQIPAREAGGANRAEERLTGEGAPLHHGRSGSEAGKGAGRRPPFGQKGPLWEAAQRWLGWTSPDANMSGPPLSSHRVGLAIAMCLCEKLAPRGTSPTKEPPNRGGLMTMGEDTHCPRRLGRGAPSCASPASRQRTGTAHRRPPTGGSQPSPPRSLEPRRGRGHEGPNQRSGADVTDWECQQGGAGDWGPGREGLCREWHNRLHRGGQS